MRMRKKSGSRGVKEDGERKKKAGWGIKNAGAAGEGGGGNRRWGGGTEGVERKKKQEG